MITRQKKEQLIKELSEKIGESKSLMVCDFKGMTVAELIRILRQEKDKALVKTKGRSKSERRQACKPFNDLLQQFEGEDPGKVITVDLSTIEGFNG
jgi:bifunctional ADP-heptose synthase (sugar kinase/adenylyltransferase)